MALVRTAGQYGATIANHAEVISLLSEEVKVYGAQVRDQIGEQEFTIRARHIVNATGVFAEQVEALDGEQPQVQIEPSKGVHLVFSRETLQLGDEAVVL